MYVYSEIYIYVSRKLVTVAEALAGLGSNCCVTCFCHKIKKKRLFFLTSVYHITVWVLIIYSGTVVVQPPAHRGPCHPAQRPCHLRRLHLTAPRHPPHCRSSLMQRHTSPILRLMVTCLYYISYYFIAFAYLMFHLTYNSAYWYCQQFFL